MHHLRGQNVVDSRGKEIVLRAEKGTVWHIDVSSIVWTLICNGKLANQIVRLVAIVVKNYFDTKFLTFYSLLPFMLDPDFILQYT